MQTWPADAMWPGATSCPQVAGVQTQKLQTKVRSKDAKHSSVARAGAQGMESLRIASTTLEYCEQRLEEYLDKCKEANISLPTLPGLVEA